MSTTSLTDSTVVVTGAYGGIGRALVTDLLEQGAQVVAADIVADKGPWSGSPDPENLLSHHVDISDWRSCEALAKATYERFGSVDALVNNAAIDAPPGLAWEITEEHWDRLVSVNLSGAWRCTRAFLDGMREQKHGRVVMMSSITARHGSARYSPAYAAAKAGLIGLTSGLSAQLEADGILVNAITPGATGNTGTPMTPDEAASLDRDFPLGVGGTQPVVDAVNYLLGPSGSWISGAVLNVTGGQLRGI
ncbi:SDR family NAD(P)-dependent oxidoreductase [Streptomyces sp. NPDC001663]|uniref:SDR family NAD(P)-dependent oxidoreductase n=1 Tax=Streptomyces sp. NPDC001663 TaxID=3364597 RepID=UPI0036CEBC23